jgi:hypothetical protein
MMSANANPVPIRVVHVVDAIDVQIATTTTSATPAPAVTGSDGTRGDGMPRIGPSVSRDPGRNTRTPNSMIAGITVRRLMNSSLVGR